MKRRSFLRTLPTALLGAALLPVSERVALAEGRSQWFELARPLMGSVTSIAVYESDGERAHRVLADAFGLAEQAVGVISEWERKSLTSRLNADRTVSLREVSPIFQAFLRHAESARASLTGRFQPMMLDAAQMWRRARAAGSVPDRAELRRSLEHARATRLEWNDQRVGLVGPGRIDSGGFGKGFIADITAEFLKRRGVRFGRVACSGDLRFFGPTQWLVDIEHPNQDRLLGQVKLFGDAAISTSGSYRETWAVNGIDYHHLIDSRTGWPAEENRQVTVVATTAVAADAFATGVFAFPSGEVHEVLLKKHSQAVVIDRHGKITNSLHAWTALSHA